MKQEAPEPSVSLHIRWPVSVSEPVVLLPVVRGLQARGSPTAGPDSCAGGTGLAAHQDAVCSWWEVLRIPAGLGRDWSVASRTLVLGTKVDKKVKGKFPKTQ